MQRELHRLPGRAASALLAVVAAAAALAVAIPVAHGHLAGAQETSSWSDAQPVEGGAVPGVEPCSLCLATGHAPAALASATALPAPVSADRVVRPQVVPSLAAAPRGPAEARAPPARG